jgi:hypothetical protein
MRNFEASKPVPMISTSIGCSAPSPVTTPAGLISVIFSVTSCTLSRVSVRAQIPLSRRIRLAPTG